MNFENVFLPTVARLSALISRHYGCTLEYKTLKELYNSAEIAGPVCNGLMNGSSVHTENFIFVPIFHDSALAGAARISSSLQLSGSDQKHLHQMVRLLLESSLKNIERLDVLDFFENQAEALRIEKKNVESGAPEAPMAKTNVVPLNKYRKNPFPLPEKESAIPLNFPLLIESQNPNDIHMMALEVHSRTNRYAFLPIEDLNPDVFASIDSLRALGHMTIFINDITKLSREKQEQLAEYYRSERDKDGPQVITGTLTPVGQLKQNPQFSSELLDLLKSSYLHMSRPFSTYKRDNVLDFFYESLTGRTSV